MSEEAIHSTAPPAAILPEPGEDPAEVRLPRAAPKVIALVFRLGILSGRQVAALWDAPRAERSVRGLLFTLQQAGLLRLHRYRCPYAPANQRWLLVPESRQGRLHWENLYSLTEEGVRYAAEYVEIPPARAKTSYRLSYHDFRRDHAYLRNESFAMLASQRHESVRWRLKRIEAEGGVGRVRLPALPGYGPGWLDPDGFIELENELALAGADQPEPARLVFIESDTGSQDTVARISKKIEGYSRWYLDGTPAPAGLDIVSRPAVLFISPTRTRSASVQKYIQRAALGDWKSPLRLLHRQLKDEGQPRGSQALFATTNLEDLREFGAWGPAYKYLHDPQPGPLIRPSVPPL